jgi:hypothetical protein
MKRSETPQNMSFGSNGVDRVRLLREIPTRLSLANLRDNVASRIILHRLSCSNKTAQNARKHEFLVQWSGSGAFVAKNSDATLFCELLR